MGPCTQSMDQFLLPFHKCTADSGKSTFMKQLRLIYGKGYTEEERHCFARLIYQNIFNAMQVLIRAMIELKIPYTSLQNEIYAQRIQNQIPEKVTKLQRHYVEAIRHLWADEGFQICYKDGGQFKLDSTKYFIDNLDRIAADDYIPTCQDILRVRLSTTGIIEYTFSVQKIILRFVDVGGQKSERRKWIHHFENVTALLYVASLSEYDEVLMENSSENRMRESLALFNSIIRNPWFTKSSIILFLNKTDMLEEKIQFSDLKNNFPEFEGKCQDVHGAMVFIRKLYEQETFCQETNTSRNIYCQFICAMNTAKTRELFDYVKDIVLTESLKENKTL
ncbi:guanine nucleotide-binding protein subunit alpha-11-like isoform X2 [Danio aesculapii]|uniref:guanine nucleotide-binding protein subunit alpha-11-like isoform X2 n=1 Tax=Danio aesculapii TaxID=1142201 RepID=UPI0024BF72E6|nr:guanine nucleotide-binding protein subunit alpha-11-like isoform X2 [Danio aesculapii]